MENIAVSIILKYSNMQKEDQKDQKIWERNWKGWSINFQKS